MSSKDNVELNKILKAASQSVPPPSQKTRPRSGYDDGWDEDDMIKAGLTQWSTSDGKVFFPTSRTAQELTPGVYEVRMNPSQGLYFQKVPTKAESLLKFPDSNSDKVISEIEKFWARENLFNHYGLAYKRGIILWGPPGTGKSCTIQLVCKDVIERGGIVIKFGVPDLFKEGIRYFREIQSDTPCVVLMEDIDSTLEIYNESEVLNILDGVDECTKTVFLATTNYPATLGERIMNRPSRFDKRFKIGFPTKEARRLYFEYLIQNNEKDDESVPESVKDMKIDIDKWVQDTRGFSVSHLKELFIAVVILGDDYDEAVETLQTMIDVGNEVEKEDGGGMGFGADKVAEEW
tara:strand:+ start:41268 stop:42311 length:1044 start_codon:yes stop_codon:yes gene_type:complete